MLNSSNIKPQILPDHAVTLVPHILMQDVADETALLNLQTEKYFSQNAIATEMLSVLTESDSIAAAYTVLLERYEVTPERLQQDLLGFVEQLLKAELIELQVRA